MRFEPWQFIANTVQRGMIMEWGSPEIPEFQRSQCCGQWGDFHYIHGMVLRLKTDRYGSG
jgi:hypothetical protein